MPDDYDVQIRALRRARGLSQAQLATLVGAARKAVVYQWEARKRTPSPLFWQHRGDEVRAELAPEHGGDRGAFGALAAGLTTQAARWLWDAFLAVLSGGWATFAAWWNSL